MSTATGPRYRQTLFQLRIYPIAIVLGLATGALASAFIWAVFALKNALWQRQDWVYSHWLIFAICTTGGLLVGLLNHLSQAQQASAHDLEEVFEDVENIESKALPRASDVLRRAALGVTSLGFGGPLGPEAPLIEIASQMSARMASVLRLARFEAVQISVAGALGALFGAPLAIATDETIHVNGVRAKVQRLVRLGPELIAGFSAFIVFKQLLPTSGLHTFESTISQVTDLIGLSLFWIVATSLLVGISIQSLQKTIPTVRLMTVKYLPGGSIVAGLISGIVLGIGGMTNEMVLFSGHHEIQELLNSDHNWKFLLGILLLKVVVLIACLAGGWFGGQIFPMAFIGVSMALAVGDLTATANLLMLAGAGFVAAVTVGLKKPLLSLILGLLLFPQDVWLALIVASAVATVFLHQSDIKPAQTH